LINQESQSDYIKIVFDYFEKNPGIFHTAKEISNKLDININTVRSSLSRLTLYNKIYKYRRGLYYYGRLPISPQQKKITDVGK